MHTHTNIETRHRMRAPGGDSLPLLRAMALLYSHQGRYDVALSILLRLRDPGVFAFVRKHGLLANLAQCVPGTDFCLYAYCLLLAMPNALILWQSAFFCTT